MCTSVIKCTTQNETKKKEPVQSLRSRSPRCHSRSRRSGNCSPADTTGERGGKRSELCTAIGFLQPHEDQIYTYQTRGVAARAIAALSAVGQGALLATLLIAFLEEKKPTVGLNKHAEANTLRARERENIYIYLFHISLTALPPQSHSSPTSTKPLPHSVGSNSCQQGAEQSVTHVKKHK